MGVLWHTDVYRMIEVGVRQATKNYVGGGTAYLYRTHSHLSLVKNMYVHIYIYLSLSLSCTCDTDTASNNGLCMFREGKIKYSPREDWLLYPLHVEALFRLLFSPVRCYMTKDEVKGDKGSVSLENHTTWHLDAKKSAWWNGRDHVFVCT